MSEVLIGNAGAVECIGEVGGVMGVGVGRGRGSEVVGGVKVKGGEMAVACPWGGAIMRGVKECAGFFVFRDDNSASYFLTASSSSLMVLRN